MKIQVTQDDIGNGVQSDCVNCPVALAISRGVGQVTSVGFLSYLIENRIPGDLPREVTNWIRNFDCGDTVLPFEFELKLEDYIKSLTKGS